MRKKITELSTLVIGILLIFVVLSLILTLFLHDIQLSAFAALALMFGVTYYNHKMERQEQANFTNQCNFVYDEVLTYITACMQTPSWAPNIVVPTEMISSNAGLCPTFETRSFVTTLSMRTVNRAALTSGNLTQLQQILNTDLQVALQNNTLPCKNIKVGFPINSNNEIRIMIEVFL